MNDCAPPDVAPASGGGRLAENIVHFARALRAAGLPLGPGRALDALAAVRAAGLGNRDNFYWCLHALFVSDPAHHPVFDQAFHVFWRNPRILERIRDLLLPDIRVAPGAERRALSRRVTEALLAGRKVPETAARDSAREREYDFDMTLSWSDRERLQAIDFDAMSIAEVGEAKKALARMTLPVRDLPVRRCRPAHHGERVDLRAALRAVARNAGGELELPVKRRRKLPPPVVVLCDISGSMSRYSRMMLHFAHGLCSTRRRLYCFVFGTRLTNITRHLRQRDIDLALARVAGSVEDWKGGTLIGPCLARFNKQWARRIPLQGALVLLVSDGLDRSGDDGLARETERLARSCRRLVWLNPLLRYDGFAPRAAGIRAMLPHVDEHRPVHNLESVKALAAALDGGVRRGSRAASWRGAE